MKKLGLRKLDEEVERQEEKMERKDVRKLDGRFGIKKTGSVKRNTQEHSGKS